MTIDLNVTLDGQPDPAQFIKWLRQIDSSRRIWRKFSDFVELAYYTVAKTMTPGAERREIEESYMRIVRTYDDKDNVRQYPKLFAYAQMAVARHGMDFLGMVAGELGSLDAKNGQFFTPMDVARLKAEMILSPDYLSKLFDKSGFFILYEAAVGAGSLVIAAAEQVKALGYNVQETLLVHAVEVDMLIHKMCYLQLSWGGIPAYVEHGNSLTQEHFDGVYTPSANLFFQKHGHTFPPRPEPADEEQQPTTPADVAERYDVSRAQQMSLFDLGGS